MMSPMTLVEFLLARIAEDEAAMEVPDWYCTESARGEGWGSRGNCLICDAYMFDGTEVVTKDAMLDHLEQVHQRTRVLAECDAKRRMVVRYLRGDTAHGEDFMTDEWVLANIGEPEWWEPESERLGTDMMKMLASAFAGHADFQDEWLLPT